MLNVFLTIGIRGKGDGFDSVNVAWSIYWQNRLTVYMCDEIRLHAVACNHGLMPDLNMARKCLYKVVFEPEKK